MKTAPEEQLKEMWETAPLKLLHPKALEVMHLLIEVSLNTENFQDLDWIHTAKANQVRQELCKEFIQSFPKATNVFRIPVLSEEACELVGRLYETYKAEPNPDEDPEYRINEILIKEENRLLDDVFTGIYAAVVIPVQILMFGIYSPVIESIQLGTYVSDGSSTSSVGYHTDQDSEHTVVIELDGTTAERGASFSIFPGIELGIGNTGYATLFTGKTTMHRSHPISEGVRQILVYWTNTSIDIPEE